MLPKKFRLPRQTFDHVLRTGKRIQNPLLRVMYIHHTDMQPRFAFVVGTKIAKRASDRNRIKRLFRESVRHLLPTVNPGFDCIIIAKKNFSEKSKKEIEGSLKTMLTHIHLLNNGPMKQ